MCFKQKINCANRLSVVFYPSRHLPCVDFVRFRKISRIFEDVTTHEWEQAEPTAIAPWKQKKILYRMEYSPVSMGRGMHSKHRSETGVWEFTWLVKGSTNQILHRWIGHTLLFLTKQKSGLYHLWLSSYSRNSHPFSFFGIDNSDVHDVMFRGGCLETRNVCGWHVSQ